MPLKTYKEIGPGGIRYSLGPRGDLVNDDMFWLRFTHPRKGRQCRIPTKTALISEARIFAAQYLQTFIVELNDPTKTTVADLMKALLDDYGEGTRNYVDVERAWNLRMKPIFGHVLATDLKTTDIRDYKAYLRGQPITTGLFAGIKPYGKILAKGTINRDLAILSRAFSFGIENEVISRMPRFKQYNNKAARRRGFILQEQFDRIVSGKMRSSIRALLETLYVTGIRIGEAGKITVGQLDFANRIIRLEETKNGDPRNAPMTTTLYHLLLGCAEGKSDTDLLFPRPYGGQIGNVRKQWNILVAAAGISRPMLIHDMRRSAVRNMVRRGVPEKVAMTISGHKTRNVFDAYNITTLTEQQEAANLIEAGAEDERAKSNKARKDQAELERMYALGGRKEEEE